MNVIEEIAAERERQKSAEGWTEAHDDEHAAHEMSVAAACYANPWALNDWRDVRGDESPEARGPFMRVPRLWPWHWSWWKPKDRRRDLIRAAALIVAEIERLDRAAPSAPTKEQP